jgi:phenylacetic acid degradation operon negative regulatory protein
LASPHVISPPNPQQLVLRLLVATDDSAFPARAAVTAGAVFGIRENSMRVALVRLSAAGMIQATGRGEYRIGPNAASLVDDVRSWRDAEARALAAWDGAWVGAVGAPLARSDRSAQRRRERAFDLLGLKELERNLFVRPDNLVGGITAVRARLEKLGVDGESCGVFQMRDLDTDRDARARTLWNGKKLTRGYVESRRALEAWLEKAPQLDPVTAAREAFLMGHEAIRALVFDPLLPSPLVDVKERAAFAKTVLRYDRAGHVIWRRLLRAALSDERPEAAVARH